MIGFENFGFSAFNTSFAIISIMSAVMFVLVIGIFAVVLVKGIGQWNKNNRSPRLAVAATVVSKRTDVSHSHRNHHTSHHTYYYVTFQVESGDRMELHMSGYEYGMLVEGDRGTLHFQGTRYLGFERM